ncbi:hypothetical protein [Blastococcus atacamensis]|uniref:hypothetical protein n=1 Tax=Blastococcus atacamensis TaxID=2070508 RepID=UPI0012FFF70E|nr:hypothetical protein [Blastococcus atacamensis]
MPKKSSTHEEQQPYTVADAAMDTVGFVVETVVVAPVWWLIENTVGAVLDG